MATFTGTAGADVISALSGVIDGFTGGTLDQLRDTVGDVISGAGGDDSITGGSGADSLLGGEGNDTLAGGGSNNLLRDTLDGGGGDDVLSAGSAYAMLFGGLGNDTLTANMAFGEAEGGIGADRIIGSTGFVAGSLSYRNSGAAVDINLATNFATGGDATGDVISGFVNAIGSAHNDRIVASNSSPGSILGLAGDDTLRGGGFDDVLNGGTGRDRIFGLGGDDRLYANGEGDVVDGGTGVDTLDYSQSSVALRLDLQLQRGFLGAAGDRWQSIEAVVGSTAGDTLDGSRRDDRMDGDFGSDSLSGLGGNDSLRGGDGNDTLLGGAGNDTISDGYGADVIFGGLGRDLLDSGSIFTGITLDLAVGTRTAGSVVDSIDGIEDALGTSSNDSLFGDSQDNRLDGSSGSDLVEGRGGADTLLGGSGADTLDGGTGRDQVVIVAFSGVTVNLATGTGTSGDAEGDRYLGIEDVTIQAFFAAATLIGNGAANRLRGGRSDDTISGGNGDDTITGDGGDDTMTGNAGADTFVFLTDTPFGDVDAITDFGANDLIGLDRTAFNTFGPTLTASEFRLGTAAQDVDDRFLFDMATGTLRYDEDGTGASAAVVLVILQGGATLGVGDFILVN